MSDCIIDTNVLLVASASDPSSPFGDSDHVPLDHQELVLKWLIDFRVDGQRKLVLDQSFKIWDEYHNQMTRGRDIGSLIVAEKLLFARFVEIAFDNDGNGILPPEYNEVDLSDRKFVAVALNDHVDGGSSAIVAACDRGWYKCEGILKQGGVSVVQIVEEWSRRVWNEKQKEKINSVGNRSKRSRKR